MLIFVITPGKQASMSVFCFVVVPMSINLTPSLCIMSMTHKCSIKTMSFFGLFSCSLFFLACKKLDSGASYDGAHVHCNTIGLPRMQPPLCAPSHAFYSCGVLWRPIVIIHQSEILCRCTHHTNTASTVTCNWPALTNFYAISAHWANWLCRQEHLWLLQLVCILWPYFCGGWWKFRFSFQNFQLLLPHLCAASLNHQLTEV